MCIDSTYIKSFSFEVDHGYQTDIISSDIKNISVISDRNAGIEGFPDLRNIAPVCSCRRCFFIPVIKRAGTQSMSCDEIPDNRPCDDSHFLPF